MNTSNTQLYRCNNSIFDQIPIQFRILRVKYQNKPQYHHQATTFVRHQQALATTINNNQTSWILVHNTIWFYFIVSWNECERLNLVTNLNKFSGVNWMYTILTMFLIWISLLLRLLGCSHNALNLYWKKILYRLLYSQIWS